MSPFDTPARRTDPEAPTDLVDELRHTRQQPNLARGIVWADILAAIAADEAARQQQRQLPEAA
ncbi:DUF6222 family protein [Actinophytocola oryzae]|uniref:Uncharacterized protein n=1 Tax=Actinophytocola oryzae TaxID=502181 RepID=A0A4R7UWZ3_9PSEU|nr:DUF6222 family protein [Actinophytocola oryzae]TDV41040.1 hypothetical protein CLV71_121106 [Actinophytocola oryzae]